jgi:uridine kinase
MRCKRALKAKMLKAKIRNIEKNRKRMLHLMKSLNWMNRKLIKFFQKAMDMSIQWLQENTLTLEKLKKQIEVKENE